MTDTKQPTLPRSENGRYDAYAWPGGYPVFYLAADNGVLCADCASTEPAPDAVLDPDCPDDDQWRVVAADINWEDPELYCDHCNTRIESAYADDDTKGGAR